MKTGRKVATAEQALVAKGEKLVANASKPCKSKQTGFGMFNVHLCLLLADLQAYLLSVFVKAGCLLLDVLLSVGD